MPDPALLALADGTVFRGRSIGAAGRSVGEVVFNPAMTGYQEILTDPSYARQIVTLTYPHIGNTGVNREDTESARIFAAGLVVRYLSRRVSSWRADGALAELLREQGIVAIDDVDTRMLTRLLREKGAQNGCLAAGPDPDADAAVRAAREFPGIEGMDLAREVSVAESYTWAEGSWQRPGGYRAAGPPRLHVVAYDFGIKRNILRLLTDRGCAVTVVPASTSAARVLARQPDGVFLSNGPGDPRPCDYAIRAIGELLHTGTPVFGICLGHQLLALACGGRISKMKFGHHGANHPVQDLDSERVYITSQNHGFAVDEDSLPPGVRVTHRSLFDGSVQGLERIDVPAFSFQGHPEASPGPHDIAGSFDRFVRIMESSKGIAGSDSADSRHA